MKENEAIEIVRKEKAYMDAHAGRSQSEAFEMAIQALEEVQPYRALGTVEELKALKEKSEPKKVIRLSDDKYYDYKCPTCGLPDLNCMGKKYCNCGQKLERNEVK